MLKRGGMQRIDVVALRCPRRETRAPHHIDAEYSRKGHVSLLGVWCDDLEVDVRPEREESVARSPARMPPSNARTNAEQLLDLIDAVIEIG